MEVLNSSIRYSPVGEYLRLVILQRLTRGSASIEEIDELARKAVESLNIKYNWRVWPRLLENEVEVKDGVVRITPRGKWLFEITKEEVEMYIKKWLGVSP
jgi:hypothetical protein